MHAFLYDIKVVTTSNVKIVLDITQKNIYESILANHVFEIHIA